MPDGWIPEVVHDHCAVRVKESANLLEAIDAISGAAGRRVRNLPTSGRLRLREMLRERLLERAARRRTGPRSRPMSLSAVAIPTRVVHEFLSRIHQENEQHEPEDRSHRRQRAVRHAGL